MQFNAVLVWNGQAVQGHGVDTGASVSCLPQRVNTNYLMPVEDQKLQGIIVILFIYFFTKLEGCEPLQEFIEAHKKERFCTRN
jgi:hypothetical protein